MHMASLTLLQGTVPTEGPLRLDGGTTRPTVVLDELLSPHEGKDVQVVAYHFPQGALDPSRVGAGTCLWPVGKCPFHTTTPTSLFSVKAQGTLARQGDGGWMVGTTPLRLESLRGHHAGLVFFPVPDANADPAAVTPSDMSNLLGHMEGLQGLLSQVRARRNGQG